MPPEARRNTSHTVDGRAHPVGCAADHRQHEVVAQGQSVGGGDRLELLAGHELERHQSRHEARLAGPGPGVRAHRPGAVLSAAGAADTDDAGEDGVTR